MELKTHGFISSAHKLPNYKGKCVNLHGHTWAYYVHAYCPDEKLKDGMIFDFSLFKSLDHQYINKFVEMPTAENMIHYLANQIWKFNPAVEIINLRLWEDIEGLIDMKRLENGEGEFVSLHRPDKNKLPKPKTGLNTEIAKKEGGDSENRQ